MDMPQISVVIPVYNVENYIAHCIDSVINQTFYDFELILVNDGSTDSSGDICDKYAKKDKRIHVIHQENGGPASARNTGLDWSFRNSNSEWLMFIDSDDWIHSQCLEIMLKAATDLNAELSRCFRLSVNEMIKENPICRYAPKSLSPQEAYFINNSGAAPWGKLYRKRLFKDIRYPTSKFAEDMFTTYKLFFRCENIAVLENELYYYRYNPDSLTRSDWKPNRLDEFEAFEEQIIYFKEKKLHDVFNQLIDKYLMAIANQFFSIVDSSFSDNEKNKYKKIMRKRMRFLIFRFPSVTLKNFKKRAWCFEIAFPRLIGAYWKLSGLSAKLRCRK